MSMIVLNINETIQNDFYFSNDRAHFIQLDLLDPLFKSVFVYFSWRLQRSACLKCADKVHYWSSPRKHNKESLWQPQKNTSTNNHVIIEAVS